MVHELAHALVRIDRRGIDPKLDCAAEGVVVKSVVYSVCGSRGLDSSGSALLYVTGWAERAEGDPIEAYSELSTCWSAGGGGGVRGPGRAPLSPGGWGRLDRQGEVSP